MPLQVGSAYSEYTLKIDDFRRNIAEVKRELAELDKLGKTQPARAPRVSGGADDARAAIAAQRLATERERTAVVTNQAAVAAQRLATEEQRTAIAVANASAAQARAEQTALRLAKAQQQAAAAASRAQSGGLGPALPRTIDGLSGSALNAAIALTGIGTAMAAVSKGVELAQLGAQASLTETRFNALAKAAGTTGSAIMDALRAASGGEISDLNLQLSANRAQLLGVADSAEEFSVLMGIARDRAQSMGISTTQAFNDLVTGLGRGSALILDNLGIMVSVEEVNRNYAASIGKTVAALTDAEKKQALINAVISQGRESIAATGGAVESTAAAYAKLGTASANAQVALGKILDSLASPIAGAAAGPLQTLANNLSALANAGTQAEGVAARILETSATFSAYTTSVAAANAELGKVGLTLNPLSQAQFAYAQSLIATGTAATQAADAARQHAAVIAAAETASTDWGASTTALRDRMLELASISAENRAQIDALALGYVNGHISASQLDIALGGLEQRQLAVANAAGYAAQRTGEYTNAEYEAAIAAEQSAQQSLLDAQAKELQGIQTEILEQETLAAANAFLELNPNMSATQAAAAAGAAGLDPLIVKLIELIARTREARDELALLGASGAAGGVGGKPQGARGRVGGARASAVKVNRAEAAKAQRVRGGGGGGGAKGRKPAAIKLSDQEKLNNQLLADQQKADFQFEDEELKHQKRLADIERAGAAERLRAERDYNLSRLNSRVGFYSQLGRIEDAGIRQALSERYEAAAVEAGQIAATQGADAAQAFLQAQRSAIEAEGQIQAEIAQAEKDKDTGRAEYLRGILKLQQEAGAAEVQAARDAGSTIANEQAAKIAEENLRYEEAQGRIADLSNRTTQLKIDNAARAGKAIDAETLAYDRQAKVIAKTAPGAGDSPTPAESVAAPPPASPARAAGGDVLLVRDLDVVTAITAQTNMQVGKFDALIGEVVGLRREVAGLRSGAGALV